MFRPAAETKSRGDCSPDIRAIRVIRGENYFCAREATRLRLGLRRGWQTRHYFGASEFTIFWKHGSPRSGLISDLTVLTARTFSLAGRNRTGL
jgi:hypothetical protein